MLSPAPREASLHLALCFGPEHQEYLKEAQSQKWPLCQTRVVGTQSWVRDGSSRPPSGTTSFHGQTRLKTLLGLSYPFHVGSHQ